MKTSEGFRRGLAHATCRLTNQFIEHECFSYDLLGWLLARTLRTAARDGETTLGKASVFGQKYEIRFPMSGPQGSYTVLSVWIIPTGVEIPYLVTAYIE